MQTTDSSHELKSSRVLEDTADDRADRLAEVRAELAALVADVTKVVEARTTRVKNAALDGAEVGVDFARDTIRSQPLPAVAIALVVGAAVAVALTPAPRRSRSAQLTDWTPDIREMAQGVQRAASSSGSSLLSAFERVVDSVTTIDPKSSLTPAIEKAAAWLGSLRETMSRK